MYLVTRDKTEGRLGLSLIMRLMIKYQLVLALLIIYQVIILLLIAIRITIESLQN